MSRHITPAQAEGLVLAAAHANKVGLPLNRFLTILWGQAEIPGRIQDAQARFLELMRKWFRYRGVKTAYVWVIENGSEKGLHAHILVHVPRAYEKEWRRAVPKWIEGKVGRGIIRSKRVGFKNTPRKSIGPIKGVLKYVLKGVSERSASLLRIERANQGSVMGKRVGNSQNIGPTARNAYAQEKWAERLVRARDHINWASHAAPSSIRNVCNNAFADDLDIPDFLRRTKVAR